MNFNTVAREIWQWAQERNIFLFASYIPSAENVEADELSRLKNPDTEWELAHIEYNRIIKCFDFPEIDLFASGENAKCKKFCTRFPEPGALAIDAFAINWSDLNFYAFPPFSLILKVLGKIKREKAVFSFYRTGLISHGIRC